MNRIDVMQDFFLQGHYQKVSKKLTEAEFDLVVAFVEENESLGHLEFEYAVNRMFLNVANKPRNWVIVTEILMALNTRAKGNERKGARMLKSKAMIVVPFLLLNAACNSSSPGPSTNTSLIATAGGTATQASPTPTPTGTGTPAPTVAQSATNSDHTCNIMSDQSIECSGTNTFNQAPGTITNVPNPSKIVVGTSISCAIGSDQNTYCWGQGPYLGVGSSHADTPTPVVSVNHTTISMNYAVAIAAYGSFGCAIYTQTLGGAQSVPVCWGLNASGYTDSNSTEDVGLVTDTLTQVAVGNGMNCVLGSKLWCWNNSTALTQQNLWTAAVYSSITTNPTGQICVTGTSSGTARSQCYSSIVGGQL